MSLADVVSLHLPLEPETAGLVDVRKLKAGGILVNTARGALVNEDHLMGVVGLDVFAAEPLPPGHPLLALKNVGAREREKAARRIAAAKPRRVKSVGKTIT